MLEWIIPLAVGAIAVGAFAAIGSKTVRSFAEGVLSAAKAAGKAIARAIVAVAKKATIVAVSTAAGIKPAIAWTLGMGVGILDKSRRIVKADERALESLKAIGDSTIEHAVESTGKWVVECALS